MAFQRLREQSLRSKISRDAGPRRADERSGPDVEPIDGGRERGKAERGACRVARDRGPVGEAWRRSRAAGGQAGWSRWWRRIGVTDFWELSEGPLAGSSLHLMKLPDPISPAKLQSVTRSSISNGVGRNSPLRHTIGIKNRARILNRDFVRLFSVLTCMGCMGHIFGENVHLKNC